MGLIVLTLPEGNSYFLFEMFRDIPRCDHYYFSQAHSFHKHFCKYQSTHVHFPMSYSYSIKSNQRVSRVAYPGYNIRWNEIVTAGGSLYQWNVYRSYKISWGYSCAEEPPNTTKIYLVLSNFKINASLGEEKCAHYQLPPRAPILNSYLLFNDPATQPGYTWPSLPSSFWSNIRTLEHYQQAPSKNSGNYLRQNTQRLPRSNNSPRYRKKYMEQKCSSFTWPQNPKYHRLGTGACLQNLAPHLLSSPELT